MKRRVYIYQPDGGHHALIRGARKDELSGIPGMRSYRDRGLWVRAERIPDIVAMLEIRGLAPELIAGDPR